MRDSDAILILSAKDLSDVKRLFTDGRAFRLAIAGGKLFATFDNNRPIGIFKLPEMERVENDLRPNTFIGHGNEAPTIYKEGWEFHGILRDNKDNAPLMITALPDLANLPVNRQRQQDYSGQPQNTYRHAWGVTAMNGFVRRDSGQTVVQLRAGEGCALLTEYPAIAAMRWSAEDNNNGNRLTDTVDVTLYNLITGEPLEPFVLMDEPRSNWPPAERNRELDAAGGMIAARFYDRLFILNRDDLKNAKLPMPLHFVLKQTTFVADADKPTKLTYKVEGGNGKIMYSLACEMPGLSIDSATGDVTITPGEMMPKAIETIVQTINNRGGFPYERNPTTQPDRVAQYQQSAAERYKELGLPAPSGLPIAIPVSVIARDSEQQTALIDHVVLLEVPVGPVKKKFESNQPVAGMQQPMNNRLMRAASATNPSVGDPAEVARLQQRVQLLEQENQKLKAQLDLMKELLGQKGPTTRP
jgi:hypothetical protein